MAHFRRIAAKLLNLVRPGRAERELDREVAAHLALLEDDYRGRGLAADEARAAALRALGGIDRTKERHRDARSFPWLEHRLTDLAYATRVLRNAPGFAAVAVLTLALGIGATSAVFTQVSAIFLTPLHVRNPETLRILAWTSPRRPYAGARLNQRMWDDWIAEGIDIETFSYAAYRSLVSSDSGLADAACWRRGAVTSAEFGRVALQYVSGSYFRTVDAPPLRGRTLTPDDELAGAALPVAVISHRFWQRALGGDSAVVGRVIRLERTRATVIGVMPQGFYGVAFASAADVFLPLSAQPPRPVDDWLGCNIIARMRPGVAEEQARLQTERLIGQPILDAPPSQPFDLPRVRLVNAERGDDEFRRATSSSMTLLMAIAGLVFLVACANIAGLLVARGTARAREIGTRLALGATRSRIVAQLVTENLLVSALGAVAGLALTYALRPLLPYALAQLTGTGDVLGIELTPDVRVLAFCIALTLLNGVLFGLAPALHATRVDPLTMIRHTSSGLAALRVRFSSGKALVGLQAALSIVLLIGAGLCIRTLLNLRSVPLGYDPRGLVIVTLNTESQRPELVERVLERLKAFPGVTAAAVSQYPLFAGAERSLGLCVPGFMTNDPDHRFVDGDQVGPGYFDAWRVPIVAGREFDPGDARRRVVIVNQAFAKKFYPGQTAIGQTLGYGPTCIGTEQSVVGVAGNSTDTPRLPERPMVYVPYRRDVGFATFAVRIADADASLPALGRLFTELDTTLRGEIRTGVAYRDRAMARERVVTNLLTIAGLVALLLSAIGIYGALAYLVTRRTAEIGVRLALGARRRAIVGMVIRESLIPVALGLLGGALAAAAGTRSLESLLFGVSTTDPWTAAGAIAVVLSTAALAAAIPALRASRIDPARALRHE